MLSIDPWIFHTPSVSKSPHRILDVPRLPLTDHQRFLACLPRDKNDEVIPVLSDIARFTQTVLGWEAGDLARLASASTELEVVLPEYHQTLRPTYLVSDGGRPMM
ncbi:MAG: hypothetical protein ACREIF_11900, partial [Chthoniobacterales bacterium]